ncbi:hypothetical protein D9M68_822430 [compost metagenome]
MMLESKSRFPMLARSCTSLATPSYPGNNVEPLTPRRWHPSRRGMASENGKVYLISDTPLLYGLCSFSGTGMKVSLDS